VGEPVRFSIEQQDLIWAMWRGGDSLREIERQVSETMPRIRRFLRESGGIRPSPQRRRTDHLTAAEREEISRGIAVGWSARQIAEDLKRSPSTVSREIARDGAARATTQLMPTPPPTRKLVAQSRASLRPTRCCVSRWWPNSPTTGHQSRSRAGCAASTPMIRLCGSRTKRFTAMSICRHGRCSTPICFTTSAVIARSAGHADNGPHTDAAGF
jgi:hypothetical protein